ncbi:MAG: hypothetical protein JST00_28100 [Deltaproteobacteria bacterium]|nr:hypothetical protein [Deltaproteobacteria bacterium]
MLATLEVVACSSVGGGGAGDGGPEGAQGEGSADGEVDAQTDADTMPDADDDADAKHDADATADATPDATADADADAMPDADADAGPSVLYSGATVDFDVDATNLYMLVPPSTIAKCPVVGCGGAPPTTLLSTSQPQEIEALAGVVHYAYRSGQRVYWGQVNEDGTGAAETVAFLVGGPYTIAFKTLRTDGRYLYGGVKRTAGGQTIYYPIFKPLPGAVPPQHAHTGGPFYDVRNRLKIEYFPGDSLLPEMFSSYDQATGTSASYPIPATKPAYVTIHAAIAVMVDTTGMAYFCPRVGCVDWTWTTTTANAVAFDESYLYFGTTTEILRCAVGEMVGGTCTPTAIAAVGAPVAQLVVKPGRIYARTAAAIEGFALP